MHSNPREWSDPRGFVVPCGLPRAARPAPWMKGMTEKAVYLYCNQNERDMKEIIASIAFIVALAIELVTVKPDLA